MAARVQQLTHLFKISSVTGFNSQQIIRRILRLTLDLLSVRSAQLVLRDSTQSDIASVDTSGDKVLAKAVAAKLKKKVDWVCENNQPIGLKVKPSKDAQPVHVLIVPVCGHQNVCLGTLIVIDKENHSYFSREDTNLLAIVATQIATKLDNAWLLNKIEEERNKFANIIDQSVDGIFVTDSEGRIEIWNRAAERLTGLTEAEVMGKSSQEIGDVVERLETVQIDDHINEIKIVNKQTDRQIWLGTAYAPISYNKQTTGYVCIIRDISRQKELERSKNDFVSTASHELRSPITAIVGYLSMLQRGDAGVITNRQQAFFVDKAYANAKRMVMLIEDILMTTRVENGQIRYSMESVHLADLIDTILADVRFKAEEKQIQISYDKKNETKVYTDKDAIIQVITNIVTNAIKYTPNKGHVHINFKQDKIDNQPVLITMIKDDGVGIDPADQEKVFEKFSRIDNPLSVSAGGTGLGLYITKTIIEELGGKIWIESEKGKGSTFYISLPVARRVAKKGII
jgi:PAS domain S-box-containing protein